VGDIRQVGNVIGVELVRDWQTREAFPLSERAGIRVCERMAEAGVLTRPIGNVIVVMPPYCATAEQVEKIFAVLESSLRELFGPAV
jgi:adenosylmethionine-8-amino-7-oxononanoate aminotransferase